MKNEKEPQLNPTTDYKRSTRQYMTAEMRAQFREGVQHVLPNLIAIGKGEKMSAPDSVQIRAADILSKYAIGEHPILMFEKKEWLQIVVDVTARYITDPKQLDEWRDVLKAHFLYQI